MKVPKKIVKLAEKPLNKFAKVVPSKVKRKWELHYWKVQKEEEKDLSSRHYVDFYTKHFNLDENYYKDKRVLDVGCGPRGSLEWANMALERVGLDPLANEYLKLGAKNHKMLYVNACAEDIPYEDNYFDIVTSFNSIDHVDDLTLVIKEIKRIVKPNGLLLLITDVNHKKTITEPNSLSWDVVNNFKPDFEILEEYHYETQGGIYKSVRENIKFDHDNTTKRPGVLTVKFRKLA